MAQETTQVMIEGYRLSPQQERLWRLLQEDGEAYGADCAIELSGSLDSAALRRSLDRAVARHQPLRARYERLPGMGLPVQVVGDSGEIAWAERVVDGGRRELLEALEAELARPGAAGRPASRNAVEATLLRPASLAEGSPGAILVLRLSALAADGRSLDNLAAELASGYAAAVGDAGGDGGEAVPYIRVAEWQQRLLEDPEEEEGRGYWRQLLREPLAGARLPFELPAGDVRNVGGFAPAAVPLSPPPGCGERLTALAAELEVGEESLLVAVWLAVLARLTGVREIEVAHLWEGRDDEMLAGAVGLFARWLPVRCPIRDGAPWTALVRDLERERKAGLEAALFFRSEAGAAAPFPAFAAELVTWPEAVSAGGVTFELIHRRADFERFRVKLSLRRPAASDRSNGLSAEIVYDRHRLLPADAERLARQVELALDALLPAPESPVAGLDLLSAEERRRLVDRFNDGTHPDPSRLWRPFHHRFREQAIRAPERDAVICRDAAGRERRLSYGELAAAAERLGRRLRRLGVGADVPVALCLERSPELVVGLLGILAAGGAYVPLDPSQPALRLALMLEDARPPVLVTTAALADLFSSFTGELLFLEDELGEPAEGADESLAAPGTPVAPEQLAYVVFTSGSTGRPKGVAVEHRHLASYLDGVSERLELPAGGSYAVVSTFAADLGNTSIFPALATGGCLHVISHDLAADAAGMAEYLCRHEVDCLKIVPSHLKALQEALPEGAGEEVGESAALLPARRLVLGGEASPRAWAEALAGSSGPRIFNHYGPSETTVGVLTWELTGRSEGVDRRAGSLPLGIALPHARVYLVDRRMAPVPRWVDGEILIGGASVARGYLARPGLTAERFIPDPFSPIPGGRLYRTGDLGRHLEDGSVEFRGRVDQQVKFHGFRVELEEIRSLLNRHPGVRDSVVVVRRDPEGRDHLVAFYAARQEVPFQELRQFLAEIIPTETLPSAFVHLRRLPLTLNGKVNQEALPGFEEIRAQLAKRSEPPRDQVEELLAALWTEVLHVDRVGVTDSFFELGGHSLLATQLISRVRRVFGVELPLRVLFDDPTLGALATRIGAAMKAGEGGAEVPVIRPAPRDGELPLSFAQERLWLMHQLEPESAAYNIPVATRVRGPLRPAALAATLNEIVRRHEVLRTRFVTDAGGRPRQVIAPRLRLELPVVDLSGLEAGDGEREGRRLAAVETGRPFRLDRLPLLRARLLRLAPGEHVALFALHHAVFDAWSSDLFLKELLVAYPAFAAGRAPALPPLAVQYADFAAWQRRWVAGGGLSGQLDWWRRELGGLPEASPLPLDHPRSQVPTFRGALVVSELPKALTEEVLALSRRERVTPFMTLLAAFAALLHRRTGAEEVVVGTDVANRNHLAVEGLIGFFVNNLVLRIRLAGEPTFRELLGRVREVTLGAYAHQDLPFDRLVKELRPQRELARMPLFQVLFVLQNAPATEAEVEGLSFEPLELEAGTVKFDLALFLRQTPEGLRGAWSYNRDLFEESTLTRLAASYERLLGSLCQDPDARLDALEVESEMDRKQREEASLSRLRGLRRRPAGEAPRPSSSGPSLVEKSFLSPQATLPVILQPAARDLDLAGWAEAERAQIEALLGRHGALLFRGFDLGSVPEFERFARAACPTLYGEYGDLPREQEGEKVYHSTPYPEEMTILFHNESSHLPRWPLRQFFYCVQAAREGGETPLVDCRRLYQALDPALRRLFEERGLLYVRNFSAGLDVAWQDFFKTDDRAAVEERCRRMGMEVRFKGEDLETRQPCAAVRTHPKTGEKVFFNQVELHHPYFLGPEVRRSTLEVFGPDNLPRNVLWGDGTPIPDEVMAEVEELYWRHAVAAPWQDGDVVMVDNMLVAHARKPFTGPRKIVVAMGELVDAGELADRGELGGRG